jgi:hypothetical protein
MPGFNLGFNQKYFLSTSNVIVPAIHIGTTKG